MRPLILAGSSHPSLAQQLAKELNTTLVDRDIGQFLDGELQVRVTGNVRGEVVIIVQSFQEPISKHMLELLLLADAIKNLGAKEIIAVIPWLAYSKQDQAFLSGEPVSSQVVSKIVSTGPFARVVLLDLHSLKIVKYFSVPVTHMSFIDGFAHELKEKLKPNTMVISPDSGGIARSKQFADLLDLPLARLVKARSLTSGRVKIRRCTKEVKGKHCLFFDDLIATGATAAEGARFLSHRGAASITFCATHGLFSAGWGIFDNAGIDHIYVSDSVPIPKGAPPFITMLPLAPLLAQKLGSFMEV